MGWGFGKRSHHPGSLNPQTEVEHATLAHSLLDVGIAVCDRAKNVPLVPEQRQGISHSLEQFYRVSLPHEDVHGRRRDCASSGHNSVEKIRDYTCNEQWSRQTESQESSQGTQLSIQNPARGGTSS